MSDFKPGLEGVVAVETEIAEAGKRRWVPPLPRLSTSRLVGQYPYENVWGLLVDNDLGSKMPDPEPHEPSGLTGNAPADLRRRPLGSPGCRLRLLAWNEISDEAGGRISAASRLR